MMTTPLLMKGIDSGYRAALTARKRMMKSRVEDAKPCVIVVGFASRSG